jgi:fructose-bisphosphate aldolase class I
MNEVETNAKKLVAAGKGILAADESGGSIHKKFETMNIPDDEQHRRDYRNIFFTTPELEKYVNGVILFDETARQMADDGRDFVTYLASKGIIPGIKVDQGLEPFEGSDEKWTKGLDGLSTRLTEYYNMGARFAKWRAAFEITDHSPSEMAIQKNAEILAKYALDCQNAGIVPIVEPEVVYDGDYPIEKNIECTSKILDALFAELKNKEVKLPGCILKVNMVLAGKRYHTQSTPAEVGKATADVLKAHVPAELAGVVFLSGGQSVTQATENLQEITNQGPFPWPVTFSYARALQDPALNAWRGDNANADAARAGFRERLIANCEALIKK